MKLNIEAWKQLVGRYAGGVLKIEVGNPGYRAAYTVGMRELNPETGHPDLTVALSGFDHLEVDPDIVAALERNAPGKFALCAFGLLNIRSTLIEDYKADTPLGVFKEEEAELVVDLLAELIEHQFQLGSNAVPAINFHFHPENQIIKDIGIQLTFTISFQCSAEMWQQAFMQKSVELTAASEYHKSLVEADPMAEPITEADISGKRVLQ